VGSPPGEYLAGRFGVSDGGQERSETRTASAGDYPASSRRPTVSAPSETCRHYPLLTPHALRVAGPRILNQVLPRMTHSTLSHQKSPQARPF
jgi:hypothetical protein